MKIAIPPRPTFLRRKLNSLALSKHTQLLEVLEIPQVMETCVRNGYYEEALDLSAHVRRMAKKHGDIPIIEVSASLTCVLEYCTHFVEEIKKKSYERFLPG